MQMRFWLEYATEIFCRIWKWDFWLEYDLIILMTSWSALSNDPYDVHDSYDSRPS